MIESQSTSPCSGFFMHQAPNQSSSSPLSEGAVHQEHFKSISCSTNPVRPTQLSLSPPLRNENSKISLRGEGWGEWSHIWLLRHYLALGALPTAVGWAWRQPARPPAQDDALHLAAVLAAAPSRPNSLISKKIPWPDASPSRNPKDERPPASVSLFHVMGSASLRPVPFVIRHPSPFSCASCT